MSDLDTIPQSKDVEKAFLGEIMASKEFLEVHICQLTKEHFFSRNNSIIFETISSLHSKGVSVDAITVSSRLSELKMLDQVGGAAYVSSCQFYPAGCIPERYFSILEEKLNLRRLIELSENVDKWCFEGGNSKEIIEKIGETVISFAKDDSSGNILEETVKELVGQIDRRISGEKILGLRTSIDPWDEVMGGVNDQRFYVLAARGGRGKTAMIEQIADSFLSQNAPVLIFQKDMSPSLFILRLACRKAGISFMKYDLGHCNKFELGEIKQKALELKRKPLYLYSPANLTVEKMCSIVKIEQRIHAIKAVFLDHILNLDVGHDYRIGLTRASTRIRAAVQETRIPHIILAQLNRDGDKNERPTPSNIKEFDALYADCDHMMMLWSERDSKDVPSTEEFRVKFTVNKNRFGTEFEDELIFERPLMKFKKG